MQQLYDVVKVKSSAEDQEWLLDIILPIKAFKN